MCNFVVYREKRISLRRVINTADIVRTIERLYCILHADLIINHSQTRERKLLFSIDKKNVAQARKHGL